MVPHPLLRPIGRPPVFFRSLLLGSGSGLDKPCPCRLAAQRLFSARLADTVELLARGGDFRLIADRPVAERRNRVEKVAPKRRQLIVDPRRHRRKDGARDQSVALQPAQGQRQHTLRNAADGAAQFVEAARALAEQRHDEDRPFVADPRQDVADGAAIGGQILVPWFHQCALLCLSYMVTYLALVTNYNRGIQP